MGDYSMARIRRDCDTINTEWYSFVDFSYLLEVQKKNKKPLWIILGYSWIWNYLSSTCVWLFKLFVVHTEPKTNTNKTQTNRFTWFFKIEYVHGDNRLYIIGRMIQTLNSTQYNPTKPSVLLLHSVFILNLYLHSLSQLHYFLLCTWHTFYTCTSPPYISALSRFCLYRRALAAWLRRVMVDKRRWWLVVD